MKKDSFQELAEKLNLTLKNYIQLKMQIKDSRLRNLPRLKAYTQEANLRKQLKRLRRQIKGDSFEIDSQLLRDSIEDKTFQDENPYRQLCSPQIARKSAPVTTGLKKGKDGRYRLAEDIQDGSSSDQAIQQLPVIKEQQPPVIGTKGNDKIYIDQWGGRHSLPLVPLRKSQPVLTGCRKDKDDLSEQDKN